MRSLLIGVVLIIIVGFGGLVYRNAIERPTRPIACPLDALVCPDGTAVARTGLSCTFPACPPPNVLLPDVGISFAVPAEFIPAELPDAASVAAYEHASSTADVASVIVMRRYAIATSSTPTPSGVGAPTASVGAALATIRETAIGGASGAPVSATSFTSTVLGTRRFTVVSIERFEGVVDTAYYFARGTDVLRFDAIDKGVMNWAYPGLDTTALPAAVALRRLLTTLQGE